MKSIKFKLLLIAFVILINFFFTNKLGIVDIENMAIITAIGIDMDGDQYSITAQIAVPEEDSTSTEKKKTHLEGKGVTVGDAIKSLSDISGWYPQLVFCNLIVVGKDFQDKNVLTVLDFFARTLRIQDSALVVLTTDSTARELLSQSSPMDNISSFALQKILHKKSGFNKDVAEINIKDFCSSYYARASSSYMPIVKTITQHESSSGISSSGGGPNANSVGGTNAGGSGKTSESGGSSLFDVKTTALFKNGIKVGELSEHETLVFNLLSENSSETTISLSNVKNGVESSVNYLLTIIRNKKNIKLEVDKNNVTLKLSLNVYCKVSDQNDERSKIVLSNNIPLSEEIKRSLHDKLYKQIENLVQIIKQTDCDLLKLDEKLYRYNHKYYYEHKDRLLELMKTEIKVNVSGQK